MCVFARWTEPTKHGFRFFFSFLNRKKEDSIWFLWYCRYAFGETLSDWATVRCILNCCPNDRRTEILITFRFLMTLTMISYVLTIFASSYIIKGYSLCQRIRFMLFFILHSSAIVFDNNDNRNDSASSCSGKMKAKIISKHFILLRWWVWWHLLVLTTCFA